MAAVAHEDNWLAGEMDGGLRGRTVVMCVDHVGSERNVSEIIDDMSSGGTDLITDHSWGRRVDADLMAAGTQAGLQVARDDLGAGAVVELDVGQQDLHGGQVTRNRARASTVPRGA